MYSWFFPKQVSENDLVDLHGKVAIVTGGNTGIGYGTIQFLVRKGAKVYMASRDETKSLAAIDKLKEEDIGEGTVHWLRLDLSNPRLAKSAAQEFLQNEQRLDILVNNAARALPGPYELDQDGLLDIMVTNHISHFIFTETLLPLLKATAQEESSDVRLVNVSSMSHYRVHPDSFVGKESLNKNYGQTVNEMLDTYGNSKLANVLHIKDVQKRMDDEKIPITCISLHPGAVKTIGSDAFLEALPSLLRPISRLVWPLFFKSWRIGAMNSVFAAASTEVRSNRELYKGAYLSPVGSITIPSKQALDPRLAMELRETTNSILQELGV